jgi:hypothetical protein
MTNGFRKWTVGIGIFSFFLSCQLVANDWIKFNPSGDFLIGGKIKGEIRYYGPDWDLQVQGKKSIKINRKDGLNIHGIFTTRAGENFDFEEKISKITKNKLTYSAVMKNKDGVDTKQLCLSIGLPLGACKAVMVDDKKINLPEKFKKMSVLGTCPAKKLVLQLPDGKLLIQGDLKVMIQDNRKFKSETFSIRFNFSQSKGKVTDSSINLQIRKEYPEAAKIDISPVVNMAFRDDISDDKKGGWTDQGPGNDMRMLKTGGRRFSGIPFDIIDPAKNNNKSCIVLSGPDREYFPKEVEVDGKDQSFKYLYFLHSAAWAKSEKIFGNVEVLHNDGSTSKFDVKGKRDVFDWWAPYSYPNGAVVWTGENQRSYVGLFMSKFEIAEKPISKIKISSTGNAVWMIVALSGSKEDIPLPKEMLECYIVANKDWQPFKHSLDVEKNSALDMSFLTDAPAGKDGRVIAKNGHFAFENKPNTPVRFYGANLCFSGNYLEKKECEELAERFVRYGYNSVRFHHHDRDLVDKKAQDSLTIIPEQLDKLDYLFYCMKQRGIYITTDIFVSRALKASEVKELRDDPKIRGRDIKQLVPLSDEVLRNVQAFAKKWLNHVNPYTGLAWKDDPALYTISFINENTLFSTWNRYPHSTAAYKQALKKWVEKENIPFVSEEEKAAATTQFISNMQIRSYEEMKKYVKDELGCKALYSDCNMSSYICQTLARNRFDYVDNHGYWDHPRFPVRNWSLPYGFHNKSVISRYCNLPCRSMPTRIFGKPFSFTEFNYVFPNKYRSEGNPVIGALAAFQDWDAMYRFAFAHSHEKAVKVTSATGFDVSSDPLTLLGERIVTLLFRRGDVKIGRKEIPYIVTQDCAKTVGTKSGSGKSFPGDFGKLGLVHRIGSMVDHKGIKLPKDTEFALSAGDVKSMLDGKHVYKCDDFIISSLLKDGVLKKVDFDPEAGTTLSDTGEIAINTKANTLSLITGKSECFVLPAEKEGKGNVMQVRKNTTYATFFASSLDGKKLKDSSRILILHLTDIKNTKSKFLNEQHTLLAKNGELPHLVRKGQAEILMKLKESKTGTGKTPVLWALDISGKRIEKINVKENGEGLILFPVDTTINSTMAYELVRE